MTAKTWSWEFDRNRPRELEEGVAVPPIKDEYWERLLKAVPVQAVGFITAADALAHAAPATWLTLALGAVFVFGGLIAFLEMRQQRKATHIELLVALVAYVIWVYAQGGIFEVAGVHQPVIAGLLALGFAALLPFFAKKPVP